jgi:hypothetical protein
VKKGRWFKSYGGDLEGAWLFVHKDGDYEYRNPTSLYVHRYNTFRTREDALDWLDRCVAKVEQDEWVLYQAVSGEQP